MPLRRILLTTDLSEGSRTAYGAVAELARALGARVTLLHVFVDLIVPPPSGVPIAVPLHAPETRERLEEARRQLAAEADAGLAGIEHEARTAAAADVAGEIVRQAREGGFDLIALATHGRSGFRRMVLGSVAEAVLRRADVPVLVVPRG